MKAGKEEGEAETIAIEEALDEQKKKELEKEEQKVYLVTWYTWVLTPIHSS